MSYSKLMKSYPQLATRFVLMPSGVGRELKNLRDAIDAGAFLNESRILQQIYGSSEADVKVAGRTGDVLSFLGGLPEGYEKALARWTYAVGKELIITAVKPGELGDQIRIVFASDPNDSVTVDGMTITIKIDNDGATVPADLQALIAADARASGMIALTSTDATAIPNAFALAAPSGYLAGGSGLCMGFDIQNNQVWGNASAIAFIAKKPGLGGAKYEVAWVDNPAMVTLPTVVATRKRCTITCKMGTHTVAEVVAKVNANRIAAEHLLAVSAGAGSGAITGLDGKVYKLFLDFGTMVQVGDVYGTITGVTATSVTYTYGALAGVVLATTANVRVRLGLNDIGVMSFPTIA